MSNRNRLFFYFKFLCLQRNYNILCYLCQNSFFLIYGEFVIMYACRIHLANLSLYMQRTPSKRRSPRYTQKVDLYLKFFKMFFISFHNLIFFDMVPKIIFKPNLTLTISIRISYFRDIMQQAIYIVLFNSFKTYRFY